MLPNLNELLGTDTIKTYNKYFVKHKEYTIYRGSIQLNHQ